MKYQNTIVSEIITPMIKLYNPPGHYKNKNVDELIDIAVDLYGECLKSYGAEELRKAWIKTKISHKKWEWPTPADILANIERSIPAPKPGQKKLYPWDRMRIDIENSTKDILDVWLKDPLVDLAKIEGWYDGLMGLHSYIWEHASYQAQVKCNCSNKGYNGWAWGYNTWNEKGIDPDFNDDNIFLRSIPQVAINWMKNNKR